MAVVKKHWKFALFNILVLFGLGVLSITWLQRTAIHAEGPGEPGGTPARLEPLVFSRVSELRRELALTNIDLSAMGCSPQVSQQILSQLVTWIQQNAGGWNDAELALVAADRTFSDAHRRVNVGPRDESLPSQLETLNATRTATAIAKAALLAQAAAGVQSLLSPAQMEIWQDARHNKSLPEQFRFASNLSSEELSEIHNVYAKRGGDSVQARQLAEQVLGGSRAARLQLVGANRASSQKDVCEADRLVIVAPGSFGPTTQPITR